jgi:hypothetical protein
MLHLFKKIYLEHDVNIDYNYDRVVISELNGVQNWSEIEKISSGKLISYGKNLNSLNGIVSFINLLDTVNQQTIQTNKPVYIYADKNNYYKIISLWYKIILPNASLEDVISYVKLNFAYKNFWKYVRRNKEMISDNFLFDETKLITEYNAIFVDRNEYLSFIDDNVGSFSIELLLSSYMYNGSRKEELKKSLLTLIKIEISRCLYEYKELLLMNLADNDYLNSLGANKNYTIDNLLEIVEDQSPILKTMFDPNIWKIVGNGVYDITTNLLNTNSDDMIYFKNITDTDIDNIERFLNITSGNNPNVNGFALIEIILNTLKIIKKGSITDSELDEILDHQTSQGVMHTTGVFYSSSHPTVNTYFIQHIFKLVKNENIIPLGSYVI